MTKLTHVIAIGSHSWGKGEDAVEAVNNWRKNYGTVGNEVTIFMRAVSKDATVDGFGTLHSDGIEPLPDVKITLKQADLIWNGIDVLNELCYPVDDAVEALIDGGKFISWSEKEVVEA